MQDGGKVLWVSFLDGLQRVLLFTENESIANRTESTASLQSITQSIDLRIHGIGLSVINNETGLDILYLGVTSSGIIWESKKVTKNRFKELTINENALLEIEYQKYLVHKSVNDVQTYKLDNKFPVRKTKKKKKKNSAFGDFIVYCLFLDRLRPYDPQEDGGEKLKTQFLSSDLVVPQVVAIPKPAACEN